jgi:hypothetical protein
LARSIAPLLVVPVALILGACTLEPHYQRPPAPLPAPEGRQPEATAAADIGDAQRSLYGAQQQLQNARLQRLQNLVTLYRALGGGLREHVSTAQLIPQAATSGSVPGPSLRSAAN